jgi:putative redox protein
MGAIEVTLEGIGRCRIEHSDSGHVIHTATAIEYGGVGGRFSSTDLVAAALGSCIATNIDRVLQRAGVALDSVRIRVTKSLSNNPKRLARLAVTIVMQQAVDSSLETKLRRAAESCVVHRSLHDDVEVSLDVRAA